MDRNTLLAFLLISLVLILTPYYMELINPKKPTKAYDTPKTTETQPDPEETIISEPKKNTETKNNRSFLPSIEETATAIETDLFEALVSNRHGGSIASFKLFEHQTYDSAFVNLINSLNKDNLAIRFKTISGIDFNLDVPWSLVSPAPFGRITEPTTLTFAAQTTIGPIEKSITFFPSSYVIQVDINTAGISESVFAGKYFLTWAGGLPSTEKNKTDDLIYTNAFLYQGGELEKIKADEGDLLEKEYNGHTDWVSIRTKYFTASLVPEKNTRSVSAKLGSKKTPSGELYDVSLALEPSVKSSVFLYLGPLEHERIKALSPTLEEIMSLGWGPIRPISKGVLWTLKKMNTFIPNYGFILIIFSIVVKILVYPLTKKSYESTQAMQKLAPEITKLKEKHKNNPQKLNQATMQLYKDKGVNPLGGCLPMLLQMPLLFALFVVFRSTIELRAEPFIFWIKDLSAPDVVLTLPFSLPIYGDGVAVLPILMGLSMFVQQKMMSGGVEQQPQQKMMQYFMSVFFFLLFNQFPSGLNLYYTLFNVLTIVQQKLSPNTQNKPSVFPAK